MNLKNCSEEEIIKLVENELTTEEKERVLRHIEKCEKCKALYKFHSFISKELEKISVDVPVGYSKIVMKKIRYIKIKKQIFEVFVSIAGFLLILLITSFFTKNHNYLLLNILNGVYITFKSFITGFIEFIHVVILSIYNFLYSILVIGRAFSNILTSSKITLFSLSGFLILILILKYKKIKFLFMRR